MSRLDDLFAPQPVPEWLRFFEAEPERAVDALLWRRFYFGPLNVEEPEELLIDWALWMSADEELLGTLDGALALWVEHTWGEHPGAGDAGGGARRLADAWSALAHVVKNVDGLPRTVEALQGVFEEKDEYLGALSVSPSQDPLGRYLDALAAHQQDRSLAPFWWRLCDLGEDTRFYHASYAMAGLIGLPPLEEEAGGFREEVARGAVALARAFDRLVERGVLPEKRAESALRSIVRLAMARFPFPEPWGQVFARAAPRTGERSIRWLDKLLPGRLEVRQEEKAPPETRRFDHAGWKDRARRIAGELRRNRPAALQAAEELLAEEERFAEVSGDSYSLVRSLCTFASASRQTLPRQAVQWADTARRWEPWDAYSWTTLVKALAEWKGAEAALTLAWASVERFPENATARTGLAEVLKAAGRLEEAEQVYREAGDRFPDDAHALTGLAEVLKAAGCLEEAEQVYREAVDRFPDDEVARNGLAEVLKATDRLEEAEQVYRETVDRFPDDEVARNGLAEVLKAADRLEEAELVYREAVDRFPDNAYARTGLAEVLKAADRLEEAELVYREAVDRFPDNVVARNGLAAVLRLRGPAFLDEALNLVDGVLKRQPGRKETLAEKARILESMGRFEEAAEAYAQGHQESQEAETSTRESTSRDGTEASAQTRIAGTTGAVTAPNHVPRDAYPLEPSLPSEVRETPTAYGLPIRRNRQDRARWTSEARFYRRWARIGGGTGPARLPEALRDRADGLLHQVLSLWPQDAKALAERALLRLDAGRWSEARALILSALDILPATPALLASLARVEREEARAEKKTLREAQAAVLDPSLRLRALNPAFQPLAHLQKGRAFLALTDGMDRLHGAAKELTHLRQWIRPFLGRTEDRFEKWWGGRIEERVFFQIGPEPEVQTTEVETVTAILAERSAEIDLLEEDFWGRLSAGPAPVIAL